MSSSDLQRAVAALVDPTKVRVHRDGIAKGEWKTIESLWTQLTSSVKLGYGGGGKSKFGSVPVISTGVLALIIEIEAAVLVAAVELVGRSRGNTPDNIRAVAAALTTSDRIDGFTQRLREWAQDARGQLQLDPQRPRSVRGVRCPECGATHVSVQQDGETVRTAALTVTWAAPEDPDSYHEDSDWRVRAVECRACAHAWWRGSSLDGLIDQMLAANRSRETMADIG